VRFIFKKTAVKTDKLGNIDTVLTIVKWVIQCIISSMCGVQRHPLNIGTLKNKHKDGEQALIVVTLTFLVADVSVPKLSCQVVAPNNALKPQFMNIKSMSILSNLF
jgi:hypothetical protein